MRITRIKKSLIKISKDELKEIKVDETSLFIERDIQLKKQASLLADKYDVVVTNPTHFAVALKYDKNTMEAPTIIAKGVDSMALKIREIAKDNFVSLIENRPLAQEMYKRLEVGDIIPEDLFYAVSLVYAELYKSNDYREAI